MGCYAISLAAAFAVFVKRRGGDSAELKTLNTMLAGGSLFGIADHAWSGDLLSFSPDDLLLGIAIMAVTVGAWAAFTYAPRILKAGFQAV